MGRQHQGMDRPGFHQVQEDSGEQRKMDETGSEVICGVPTMPAVKGQVKLKESHVTKNASQCYSADHLSPEASKPHEKLMHDLFSIITHLLCE